jgi:hypothetical protein
MASNITYTTIDEQFPVAGQDNDSQGFRDNFSIIKENFRNSILEIEALQDTRARLDVENDYDGNTQKSMLLAETVTKSDSSAFTNGILSAANVSFTTGHHHVIKAEGDITLTFTDWPNSGRYAEMRVQLYSDGVSARDITLSTENAGNLKTDGNSNFSGTVVQVPVSDATSKVVKAFTYDGGDTVFLQYEGTFS